jgi:O-antigen ligase
MTLKKLNLHNLALALLYLFPTSLFLGNAATEITMCSIGALFIAMSVIDNNFKWLKTDWVKIAFIFWAYICIRSLWASDPLTSLARGVPFIRYVIFACAISFWLFKDNIKLIIYSTLFAILFFGASAITQYFIGHDFFGTPAVELNSYQRLTTFSGKMNVGIMTLMLFFPVAAYLIFNNRNIAAIYFLIACSTIFLSGERTALLMLILGLAVSFFTFKKLRGHLPYLIIIASILVSCSVYMKSHVIERQINSTYNDIATFSTNSYGLIYKSAFELFKSSPVFGIGLRHFQSECLSTKYNPSWLNPDKPYLSKSYLCVTHPHNIYLEIATETGIVGLTLFLLIISSWFKHTWHNRSQIKKDPVKLGAFINICLKLLPITAGSSFFIAWPSAPLWFMIGILYNKPNNNYKD